ncbi:EAL domain-containing protein [Mesorhizobium sp. RCC_202]
MSTLATIKDHSGRIYRGVQALLLLSIAATSIADFGLTDAASRTGALAISATSTLMALLVLRPRLPDRVRRLRHWALRFQLFEVAAIDSVKIDRSYISSLAHDQAAQIFVSALAQIARIQDIATVAEGVETAEEFMLARAAGCSRFQGYFFGRPGPRDKMSALCAAASEPLALTA